MAMNERIASFRQRLKAELVPFADTLVLISEWYRYTPTAFSNGLGENVLFSPAGSNEGSCKVFAFAQQNGFTTDETLVCFGEHYQAVLADPAGTGHPNIRLFMRDGWAGIRFDGAPLVS